MKNFEKINSFDAMLIPNLNTYWNQDRSIIRYFDALNLGAVPIMSNSQPYKEICRTSIDGFLVDNRVNELQID